ncbi:MAG: nuclear transport factor 2 family protein, partial [Planctomycetes bacterium]|nr:nuclear transport factor 2 family protein [Planctomycetota bacterium]
MRNHENEISNLLYTYTERFDLGDQEGAAELFKYAKVIVGQDGESVDYQGLLEIWRSLVIIDEKTGTPRT